MSRLSRSQSSMQVTMESDASEDNLSLTSMSDSGMSETSAPQHYHHGVAPGERTAERIRQAQRLDREFMIPRAPFTRCTRYVVDGFTPREDPGFQIQQAALDALQAACESYITRLLESANLCTIQGRRVQLEARDLELVRILRGEVSPHAVVDAPRVPQAALVTALRP